MHILVTLFKSSVHIDHFCSFSFCGHKLYVLHQKRYLFFTFSLWYISSFWMMCMQI